MDSNVIRRPWLSGELLHVDDLRGEIITGESGAQTFNIFGVDADGETVTIGGTISGTFLRADGQTVALTGSVSSGEAFVTLEDSCYAVPGRYVLAVYATDGETTVCIYTAVGNVFRSQSGTIVDPGTIIPSISALIESIETAVATIPASYSTLLASVAPTYSTSATYDVGDYAWYNGQLYRCNTAITSGESWTADHWTAVNLSDGIVALSDEIDELEDALNPALPMTYSGNVFQGRIGGSPLSWILTGSYQYSIIPVTPGANIKLTSNGSIGSVIAALTAYSTPTEGGTPSLSADTNWTGLVSVGTTTTVETLETTLPDDANYLYVQLGSSFSRLPSVLEIDGYDHVKTLVEQITDIIGDIDTVQTSVSQISDDVDTIETALNGSDSLKLITDTDYLRSGYIDADTLKWTSVTSTTLTHRIYPVASADIVRITASGQAVNIGVLTSNAAPAADASAPLSTVTGWTSLITIDKNSTEILTMPSDAAYLYIYSASNDSRLPTSIVINGHEIVGPIWQRVDALQNAGYAAYTNTKGKTLCVLGDSITYGVGTDDHFSWVDILGTTDVYGAVVKAGHSGGSIARVSGRHNFVLHYADDVDIANTDVLIISAGTNDFNQSVEIGTATDGDNTHFLQAYNTIISGVITTNPNIEIILTTPIKTMDSQPWNEANEAGATLADYADAIKQIADLYSLKVIDLYSYGGFNPLVTILKTTYQPDGTHPNEAGYKRIADYVFHQLIS